MASLNDFLVAAYDYSWRGGVDPAPACAAAIPRASLESALADLRRVQERCHISRERVKFLERCLALIPPAAAPEPTPAPMRPPYVSLEPPPEPPHHHHWWQR